MDIIQYCNVVSQKKITKNMFFWKFAIFDIGWIVGIGEIYCNILSIFGVKTPLL